jgi:hypothetical protein
MAEQSLKILHVKRIFLLARCQKKQHFLWAKNITFQAMQARRVLIGY